MSETIDVMVLAPHPDDAEMSCGGTILALVDAGLRVGVIDMTRGEKSTRGDEETRKQECNAATAILGIQHRQNLELPDGAVRDDDTALAAVIGVLRQLQPRLLLAPFARDLHPDHEAAGMIARRAWFHSGLAKVLPELGKPHRPGRMLSYPLHDETTPTLCVDISSTADRKLEALRCYASQLGDGDRSHLARLDLLQRAEARDRFYGAQVGCLAAEPFGSEGPLKLADAKLLL